MNGCVIYIYVSVSLSVCLCLGSVCASFEDDQLYGRSGGADIRGRGGWRHHGQRLEPYQVSTTTFVEMMMVVGK